LLLFGSMEKETLTTMVMEGLTLREMSDRVGKCKTSIRHWLAKYGLHTVRRKRKDPHLSGVKLCNRCSQTKDFSEFYKRRDGKDTTAYCKPCTSVQTVERQRAFKKQCIAYLGGCCEKCSYDKCDAAMEFHHVDPSKKDFNISQVKSTTFSSDVKVELDKCWLVCANCHREIHHELTLEKQHKSRQVTA
jgi:predicted HNH restriction endonuclease